MPTPTTQASIPIPIPPGCRLFVLAGQSNMVGRGWYGDLPPDQQALPGNVTLYEIALDTRLEPVGGRFGPEVGLAHALGTAMVGERLVLVKYAVDGSSLLDWAPDWDRQTAEVTGFPEFGPLYRELLAYIRQVQMEVGPDCRLAAVFWMQGERDARIPEAGAQYEARFVELIRRFREDLKMTGLPFLFGQVNPPAELYPAVDGVRAAQASVARQIAGTWLVSTDGLSKWRDGVHYDTAGQVELGRRFADLFLEIEP